MLIRYLAPGGDLESKRVKINLYNAQGRTVAEILDRVVSAGQHQLTWNGKDKNWAELSPGIYTVVLRAGSLTAASRVSLFK
jgi:hypothetical protein